MDATRTVRTWTCTRVYQTQFKKKKNCFSHRERERRHLVGLSLPSLLPPRRYKIARRELPAEWQFGSSKPSGITNDITVVTRYVFFSHQFSSSTRLNICVAPFVDVSANRFSCLVVLNIGSTRNSLSSFSHVSLYAMINFPRAQCATSMAPRVLISRAIMRVVIIDVEKKKKDTRLMSLVSSRASLTLRYFSHCRF